MWQGSPLGQHIVLVMGRHTEVVGLACEGQWCALWWCVGLWFYRHGVQFSWQHPLKHVGLLGHVLGVRLVEWKGVRYVGWKGALYRILP